MRVLCRNYAIIMRVMHIMQRPNNYADYAKIMRKLCGNYAGVMQKLRDHYACYANYALPELLC